MNERPSDNFDGLQLLQGPASGLPGRGGYWHDWAIALAALTASFAGLLALGVGFLVTSVWFWQVAGFSFATVFTQRFRLRSAT
jgi:hypothetical protein